MNDYNFWEKYLNSLKLEIKKLCEEKEKIYVDLHIHSIYSSDGKQTIKEIIETTKNKGFDIIAITDHDTVSAYDELYEILKNGLTKPLIIPGIEFTVDNKEYGNQCHQLQLFINPKDSNFLKIVNKGKKAMYARAKIQFQRLEENLAMLELKNKYSLNYSYKSYLYYLRKYNLIPEYDTLCEYLMSKFIKKNITTFHVLDLLEKYNELDVYEDRKEFKKKRFAVLRNKYEINDENKYNVRFLLSMLAVREVDDDWWDKPSSGSLSVNSYGQLTIEDLDNNYPIYFAHPTEKKIEVVRKIITNTNKIVGLEKNIRNPYQDENNFKNLLLEKKLNIIMGSDSHDATLKFYDNMEFYALSKDDIKKII